MKLSITSSAFLPDASIPAKYTCDAGNISPPLMITGIPDGTVSLALVMDDPDVPKAVKPDGMFDHWVVYSIPVMPGQTEVSIPEGTVPGIQGLNGRGQEAYTGPCPPPEYEPTEHRYFFKVYALSTELSFLAPPRKEEVEAAMKDHVIDSAELVGRYARLSQQGKAQ
ncbi:YbhB/YbcL family Raf kinase inhibitor-like protein [Patescibacteria group bacterium]|nr:YbhB/YbcL family Raf kinase inhibitor-like protein [Patescibacteria group bacterium]